MDESQWRPHKKEVLTVRTSLEETQKRWVRRRLAIVTAIMNEPKASNKLLAKKAGTRTVEVKRLLQTWHREGRNAVLRGRSRLLPQAVLQRLKRALQSGDLHTINEVDYWLRIEMKTGKTGFSTPTIRQYCRELGYELPLEKGSVLKKRRRHHWSPKQISELQALVPKSAARASALLKIGTEQKTATEAAREYGIKPQRTRRDLRYFLQGKLAKILIPRDGFLTWINGPSE